MLIPFNLEEVEVEPDGKIPHHTEQHVFLENGLRMFEVFSFLN